MSNKKLIIKTFRIIGDVLVVNLSFLISFYLRFLSFPSENMPAFFYLIPFISVFTIIILHLYDLYSNQLKKQVIDIFYSFIPASFIIILFSISLSYFFQTYAFPRSVFLITLPVMIPLMFCWRFLSLKIEKLFIEKQKIVVVGRGQETLNMLKNLKNGTNGNYKLIGVLIQDNGDYNHLLDQEIPVINSFNNFRHDLKELNPDVVFISGNIDDDYKTGIFYQSLEEDWEISIVPGFYEIMLTGTEMKQIGELPVFEMRRLQENGYSVIKRLFDITISIFALIITLPLTVPAAVLIKVESPGPIFFTQKRVSKNGREFSVYKFRTMIVDAEKSTGPILAKKNDKRITKFGKILRKTRLDEVPQLINVIEGDMSLIGPRPERPHFINKFEREIDGYKFRHRIKGGITGLAQVYGFYSSRPEDKLRLDLIYANKSSFIFDIKILLHTLKVVFMGHKAS